MSSCEKKGVYTTVCKICFRHSSAAHCTNAHPKNGNINCDFLKRKISDIFQSFPDICWNFIRRFRFSNFERLKQNTNIIAWIPTTMYLFLAEHGTWCHFSLRCFIIVSWSDCFFYVSLSLSDSIKNILFSFCVRARENVYWRALNIYILWLCVLFYCHTQFGIDWVACSAFSSSSSFSLFLSLLAVECLTPMCADDINQSCVRACAHTLPIRICVCNVVHKTNDIMALLTQKIKRPPMCVYTNGIVCGKRRHAITYAAHIIYCQTNRMRNGGNDV